MMFGMQWDINDAATLGVSLRTPSFILYDKEISSSTSIATFMDETPALSSFFDVEDTSNSGFTAYVSEPMRLRAGLGWTFDNRATLALDADVSTPIDPDSADGSKWNWNVRAGGTYPVGNNWSLGAGFFTDRSADVELPQQFYGGTFGVKFSNQDEIGKDHRPITFTSIFAARYAYGRSDAEGLLVPVLGTIDDLDNIGDSTSVISQHELSLTIGGGIHF